MTHPVTWERWNYVTLYGGERVNVVLSGTLPERMHENEALWIKHLHDNEEGREGVILQYGNC